jgi:transcriptional regulator GlxA family with amidase domain
MEALPHSDVNFSGGGTSPSAVGSLLIRQDDSKPFRHRSAALQSAARLLAEAGLALRSNKDGASLCIAKAVALLQAESDVIEMSGAPSEARRRLAPWQVSRVVRFIEANLSKKIGVDDFAEIARLSPGHFARAFRATVGEAPYAYLIRARIEYAQQLILSTDRPLAEIALDCGLADQAHMTRLFRRIVGVSPGAWRRVHRSRTGEPAKSISSKVSIGLKPGLRSLGKSSEIGAASPI